MGSYLSEPVTTKHSSEDSSDTLVVGASSMQGWRVNQEDAHNTVLNFDSGVQLFAVYDGHGGAEVAKYCSEKLPDFIRKCEAYTKGDMEEALKQAFLDLDASLTKEDVIAELRKIAVTSESDAEDEDENVANLREEASMPLEDVMAKYASSASNPLRKLKAADGKSPLSPCIRRGGSSGSAGSSTDESGPSSSGAGPSGSGSSSSGPSSNSCAAGSSSDAESANSGGSASASSAVTSSSPTKEVVEAQTDASNKPKEENEATTTEVESTSKEPTPNGPSVDKISTPQVNGDVQHAKEETAENVEIVSSTTENIAMKNGKVDEMEEPKGKGKAKDKTKSVSKDDDGQEEKKAGRTRTTPLRKLSGLQVMKFLASQDDYSDSEESEEDDDDDTFEGKLDSEDEDDEEGEEEDEDDDDDEEDYEDTDSEDEGDNFIKMGDYNEEPGSDSGCTAVVALLRGRDLFVANAGDSRCVVCRNGKAIDMSLDHKPEDAPELARILAAGGKVTCDGRVNGGLNLSRAIGDHAYKQVKDMPVTEQMITALPDVRTLRVDPKQDEFMILACDGIWNFMSSQDVVDFVRTRLVDQKLKPAKICEELFDHCLSPNTMGDGTGCDNMTAVIVQFQPSLEKEPSTLERETILESPITNETSKKGDAEDIEIEEKKKEEEEDCKEDEIKEKTAETEEESKDQSREAKKRGVDSDADETLSPRQKKVKVDSESNGVQV